MSNHQLTFGQTLRTRRLESGHSLRKFAEMVGVSPTYLSQVEQDNVDPPTAERVKQMAELLGEDADTWTALADRLSDDLKGLINREPSVIPDILRETEGMTVEQLKFVRETMRQLKGSQ